MFVCRHLTPLVVVLAVLSECRAGLYYSGETIAELPSQWRGFLLDQRQLRSVAAKPVGNAPPNPARARYEQAARALEKTGQGRALNADELADLGALYVRLGDVAKAVDLLRKAQRNHPEQFRILANLGTAWQLQGDLEQAAACLQQAVRLAPGKFQKAEEYHLKLVRLRQRERPGSQALDDLFGVRYVGASGKFEPGKLAAAERDKLPAEAAAYVQQLALWLPADGRLLWQLAELANAHGDVRTAAAILDGCVTEFGMRTPELREERRLARAAADELAKSGNPDATTTTHGGHAGGLKLRSVKPLVTHLDETALPEIKRDGVNELPWFLVTETRVGPKYRPNFPKHLTALDGKQVEMTGYMQPLGENSDLATFMLIEYPVGCWYCEMPEITAIVLVEMPTGETASYSRNKVKVVGTLLLNAEDPENFLYTISKAKVTEADEK